MSKFRYTIKELNEFSDYKLLAAVVLDRQSSCTNIYAPLYQRLQRLYYKLYNHKKLTKVDKTD
ncbi:hypothetical protein LCGC14_0375890 [marine sediment metagenome]|uniref:Uncharacterized protein n=1 Tax=marine sediment metagenome TaxID=412755 RepID=A0A0F9VQZ4_9ZZZZ